MSDFSVQMSSAEKAGLDQSIKAYNDKLNNGKPVQENMGKDEFLKLLITQLANQDPTKPMEDKEFIAQMAQFSSLEQMTNLRNDFSSMAQVLSASQAVSVLGREVDIQVGSSMVTGKVEEVTGGMYPNVKVNGQFYDYASVAAVRE